MVFNQSAPRFDYALKSPKGTFQRRTEGQTQKRSKKFLFEAQQHINEDGPPQRRMWQSISWLKK